MSDSPSFNEIGGRSLGSSAAHGIFVTDEDGVIVRVNDALVAMLGRDRHELQGTPSDSLFGDVHQSALREHAARARHRGSSSLHLVEAVSEWALTLLGLDELRGVIGIVHEAPTRGSLGMERETLPRGAVAELFESISVPLFVVGRDWRFQFVNVAGRQLAHLSPGDVDSVTIWDLFPEVQNNEMGRIYRAAMEDGRFASTVEHIDALDGDFEVAVHPALGGIMITARDVTSERLAMHQRDELRELTRSLAQMLDLTREAVMVRDFEGKITYWNRGAEVLYGWTFDEMRGRSPLPVLFDETSAIDEALAVVRRDGEWSGGLVQRSRDGRRIEVESRLRLLRDAHGTPTAIFGMHTDVTEERQRAEAQKSAQRLESLGTLAGGIAHDLNNVLTPLVMSIELLVSHGLDERDRELVERMNASVARATQMVRQVLTFARGVEGERVAVPVAPLISYVEYFCRDVMPASIEVVVDVAGDIGVVIGDETQLTQVLMNLVTNARDAMPDGGTLTIRARAVDEDDVRGRRERPWIALSVSDTGDGMDANTQARVFEPFFTTKEVGTGTGLGLAISLAIVTSHNGRLALESELGHGSTFTIELPRALDADAETSTPPRVRQGRRVSGRARRLMIVDDEEAIVTMLGEVLRASDYLVAVCTSGQEALALLREEPAAYDLIVSDVNMPHLSGPQFAARARDLGVTTRIIFMTGAGEETFVDPSSTPKDRRCLQKPFSVANLLDFVDEALSPHP